MAEPVSRLGQRLEIQELSLDIKTKVETFDSWVLISRLESRLLKFESLYWDWNRDSEILSLDIETGVETFEITVLISRLISRLKKQGGISVIETLARVTAHLCSVQHRTGHCDLQTELVKITKYIWNVCCYCSTHLFTKGKVKIRPNTVLLLNNWFLSDMNFSSRPQPWLDFHLLTILLNTILLYIGGPEVFLYTLFLSADLNMLDLLELCSYERPSLPPLTLYLLTSKNLLFLVIN